MLVAGEASQMFVRGTATSGAGGRRSGRLSAPLSSAGAAAPLSNAGPSAAAAAAAAASSAAAAAAAERSFIPRTPLHSHFQSLAAAFELAASFSAGGEEEGNGKAPQPNKPPRPQTLLPPLCSDCASRVAAELELEAEAALEEAALAEEALVRLQAEAQDEVERLLRADAL